MYVWSFIISNIKILIYSFNTTICPIVSISNMNMVEVYLRIVAYNKLHMTIFMLLEIIVNDVRSLP